MSKTSEQSNSLLSNVFTSFDSKADEDSEIKKRRTCRAGAGIEATYGLCDTDGFQERDNAKIIFDHRNFFRINLPRNNKRLLQSSCYLISSNRANGDVGVFLYDSDPLRPHPDKLQRVVGYIVEYASKSGELKSQSGTKSKRSLCRRKKMPETHQTYAVYRSSA